MVLVILGGHALLALEGVRVMNIDHYFQVLPRALMASDPGGSLFYFHAFPPLLTAILWVMDLLSGGDRYTALQCLLPLLHAGSFLLVHHSLKRGAPGLGPGLRGAGCGLFFLNPLLFIYFLYPFYATYLFFSASLLLYALTVPMTRERRLLIAAGVLCVNGLMRASFHPVLILAFLAPLAWRARGRAVLLAGLMLTAPLGLAVKNWVLFDTFGSSTWMGFNLWQHMPPDKEGRLEFNAPPPQVEPYRMSRMWPLIEAESRAYDHGHPVLHTGGINDHRLIVPARIAREDVLRHFDWGRSFLYGVVGVTRLLESPADYDTQLDPIVRHFPWIKDFFDLPNVWVFDWPDGHGVARVSLYSAVYLPVVLFLLYRFRSLSFGHRWLLVYVVLFSFIYAAVDNGEAMRMRFELEPVFLFLTLTVLARWGAWETKLSGVSARRALLLTWILAVVAGYAALWREGAERRIFERGEALYHAKDYAGALAVWRPQGERGEKHAQNALGDMTLSGIGGEKDPAAAFQWYLKAARQGHANAQNRLAYLLFSGRGTTQSSEQALVWLRKAARQGHAAARDNLRAMGLGWADE